MSGLTLAKVEVEVEAEAELGKKLYMVNQTNIVQIPIQSNLSRTDTNRCLNIPPVTTLSVIQSLKTHNDAIVIWRIGISIRILY